MATRALDVITILHALQTLDHELQVTQWQPHNPAQRELFAWLETYREHLAQVRGLEAKASRFYEELNAYLQQKGFSVRFGPFDPEEALGIVSILDKLVRWLQGAGTLSAIKTSQGMKPGFTLPKSGVHIYEVENYRGSSLLELLTQSEETLWLFVHGDTKVAGFDLMKLALDVMGRSRQTPMSRVPPWFDQKHAFPTFAGAKVPMIDFDLQPDMTWLIGADVITKSRPYFIFQAIQQFKLRMDETGARVAVATLVMAPTGRARFFAPKQKVFIVDRPFYGWWTQRGVDLPMAVFFADWDCWRTPAGPLETW